MKVRQSLQTARFDFADFLVNKIEDKRNIKGMDQMGICIIRN